MFLHPLCNVSHLTDNATAEHWLTKAPPQVAKQCTAAPLCSLPVEIQLVASADQQPKARSTQLEQQIAILLLRCTMPHPLLRLATIVV